MVWSFLGLGGLGDGWSDEKFGLYVRGVGDGASRVKSFIVQRSTHQVLSSLLPLFLASPLLSFPFSGVPPPAAEIVLASV